MFFEINKNLCDCYAGLDPLKLLDYPAEDVFDLINGLTSFSRRQDKGNKGDKGGGTNGVVRKAAGDNWF